LGDWLIADCVVQVTAAATVEPNFEALLTPERQAAFIHLQEFRQRSEVVDWDAPAV
jgi:hypothetical protein